MRQSERVRFHTKTVVCASSPVKNPNRLRNREIRGKIMANDSIRTLTANLTFSYKLGDQIKSEGNHGTLVFKGLFNGAVPIALKRYQKIDEKTTKQVQRDLEVLTSPKNWHPHLIRYYGHAADENFSYIATELCECSVADIIDPKKKIKAHEKTAYFRAIVASLSHKEILRQSSEAVSFLHRPQWNVIHRNLHPENFLIACVDPNKDYFLIKLTDFQLSKSIEKNPLNTGTINKEGWVAPESFKENIELDNKVDAFILGCYYFYVLSGGNHPFGRGVVDQRTRIKDEKDKVYRDSWDGKPEWIIDSARQDEMQLALEIIKQLIKYDPKKRKSVDHVLKSKYFQAEPNVIYDHPSSPVPGLCVIICQDKFHNPMDDVDYKLDYSGNRYEGIGLDARKLEETFKSFGYDILSFKNLRAAQMKDLLSSTMLEYLANISNKSLKNYASLIVCLLGHGDKGVINGVDGVPVSLNTIQYDAFNDQACPDLQGKPKIFIVLACQGSKTQMIQNERLNHSGLIASNSVDVDGELSSGSFMAVPCVDEDQSLAPINRPPNSVQESLPPVYDFIRLVSTIEEYTTQFDYGTGSVFIQSLCDTLSNEYKDVTNPPEKNEANKRDLAQLFTQVVIPIVGRSGGNVKQTPEFRSSLVKAIRFRLQQNHGTSLQREYNGVTDDTSFQHARKYREALLPNYTKKNIGYEHLLKTVYGEASKETEDIQRAIAWVIFNRYKLSYRPQWGVENMMRVCMATDQFKCWMNKEDIVMSDTAAKNAIERWLLTAFDGGSLDDPTGGSIYFNKPTEEGFMRQLVQTVNIGSYQFYKDP